MVSGSRGRCPALLLVLLMLLSPMSGCFGEEGGSATADDLVVGPEVLQSGVFQQVELSAGAVMSVFVPYLVVDPILGFVQNSTVIDLEKGGSVNVEMLVPPRTSMLLLMVGELGRENWPIRDSNESWSSWLARGGDLAESGNGVSRVAAQNATLDTLNSSVSLGGEVSVKVLSAQRVSSVSQSEGGEHSSGILHGRIDKRTFSIYYF